MGETTVKLLKVVVTILLIFVDRTLVDGQSCEDKMKGLIAEYNSCIDPSATFTEFCEEANEVTVENPDDEKIVAMIPKYCSGIKQEIQCAKILTNSSNECRFLSQDAVDRSDSIGETMLTFFCENDGNNFLEFTLNEEMKKFEAYGKENECDNGNYQEMEIFTTDGEFNPSFCGFVDSLHTCFNDYFAAANNPNLNGLWEELRDKVKESAKC